MLIKTKAIVISSLKFGESDLIVTCFTETVGIKSYMLKNILKTKRRTFSPALFQPLSQLEIVANHRDKGNLEYLKEVKNHYFYKSLHTHVLKSSIAVFIAEILKSSIKEEQANPELFEFLSNSFYWIDNSDSFANFHIAFMLNLSSFLGFYPEAATHRDFPFFNIAEGIFQNYKSDIYTIEGEVVGHLKQFLSKNYEESSSIHLSKNQRKQLLELLISYYQLHISGFQKPRSLSILVQLFH